MPSERVLRNIERLLDEADSAISQDDWPAVLRIAKRVLTLDPQNEDAPALIEAATRGLGDAGEVHASDPAGTSTVPISTMALPTAFVSGRYEVKSFLGEGARKRVYLAHDTRLDRDVAVAVIKSEGLDELGLADNTVIVFTSDHGDLMGDHQLMLKGAYAYQGLIRVPFIWVEPGAQAARRSGALYSTLDLAATFLDRARLAPYNGIQGKSLLPTLNGDDGAGHDGILIEYGSQRPVPALPPEFTMRTLVDERWRITVYRNVPWGELYDLAADPHELHNLWDEPASAGIRHELTERLVQKMMDMAERSPRPTHTA